jgi:hypothetical protein
MLGSQAKAKWAQRSGSKARSSLTGLAMGVTNGRLVSSEFIDKTSHVGTLR